MMAASILCLTLTSCTKQTLLELFNKRDPLETAKIKLPSGEVIRVKLALTEEEKTKGLSGVSENQFKKDEGLLFFYSKRGRRSFWMPDTYFPLDLFFLDKKLKIVDIVRNLPNHPGFQEPPPIPRARTVFAFHVLEMRSDSHLAKKLSHGDQLQWLSSISLSEIESKIRP
ncbi:MAG: DUF192 domain-containing protein [Bdellovibrionota bacterium]|nr:DUF192 domain-containing protein [Bdellovibrionota bacterium]